MFIHRKAICKLWTQGAKAGCTRKSGPGRVRAGFTLLEVLAAMALIMLVIGGVYGISGAAVELGRSMSEARIVETRVTNFVAVWRDYFENLPPDIRFSAGVEKVDRGGSGAILIEGGPMPFAWHPTLRQAEAVEFRVEHDAKRKLALVVRHLQRPERPTRPGAYEVVAEMPLLEGVEEMKWQFFEPVDDQWFSNWDPKNRPEPPLFLRMRFRLTEDSRTHEHVFWVANDLQQGRVDLGGPPRR
jgi:prepilin-type N-terminal cleavage/methylation domain-containing protein